MRHTRTRAPGERKTRKGEKFLSGKVYVPYGCFHCAGVASGRNERGTGTVINRFGWLVVSNLECPGRAG